MKIIKDFTSLVNNTKEKQRLELYTVFEKYLIPCKRYEKNMDKNIILNWTN